MDMPINAWVGRNLRGLIVDMHIGDQDAEFLSRLDPEKLADEIARASVNFVLVYAKSHWGLCLYPTRVGKMHPGLKGRDFFKDMVRLLHERDIKVVCYLTVAWEEYSAALHPEWVQRDHKGLVMTCPALRESDAEWKFLCIRSPYREVAFGHLRELVESYPVDGVFLDITASGGGPCCCKWCRKAFKDKTGKDIPVRERWQDPLFREFAQFSQATWTEFMAEARAIVDEIKPGLPVTNNFTLAPFSWRTSHRISETGNHVTYGDMENHPDNYGFGGLTFIPKLARAAVDFRHADSLFGRYHGHWDYSIKPLAQARVEVSAALATGSSATYIDHIWPDGSIEPAVYDFLGKVFSEVKSKEEWAIRSQPILHAAVLFSERNRDMMGRRNVVNYLTSVSGLARILAEAHFPFDVIMDKHLTPDTLSRFKVLMLPGARYLSDAEIHAIRDFVEDGGTLVSFRELAQSREDFSTREENPMEELIGGTFSEKPFSSPCYISFAPEDFPGSDRITSYPVPHPRRACKVLPNESARAIGRIIERYPSRTENVPWITHGLATPHKKTEHPFILINPYGRGKSIYFAGDPPAVYAERSFEEMLVLIQETLSREIEWPIWLEGPLSTEITWLEQPEKNREIIHLVNFQPETGRPLFSFQDGSTNVPIPPGLRGIGNLIARRIDKAVRPRILKMFGPDLLPWRQPPHIIKEVLPVFDLELHYRIPGDISFKNIYLAPEMKAPEINEMNGELIIRIPRLHYHTMVVLEK